MVFERVEENGIVYDRVVIDGFRCAFSTRIGGVSRGICESLKPRFDEEGYVGERGSKPSQIRGDGRIPKTEAASPSPRKSSHRYPRRGNGRDSGGGRLGHRDCGPGLGYIDGGLRSCCALGHACPLCRRCPCRPIGNGSGRRDGHVGENGRSLRRQGIRRHGLHWAGHRPGCLRSRRRCDEGGSSRMSEMAGLHGLPGWRQIPFGSLGNEPGLPGRGGGPIEPNFYSGVLHTEQPPGILLIPPGRSRRRSNDERRLDGVKEEVVSQFEISRDGSESHPENSQPAWP